MLSESSYLAAIYVYVSAALIIMVYLSWWLARHWGSGMVSLAVLLAGALLLTPAYPKEGVDTFAPALIVAAFQWMNEGIGGAGHALRPLALTSGIAVFLALLLRVTIFRGPSRPARKRKAKSKGDSKGKSARKAPARA